MRDMHPHMAFHQRSTVGVTFGQGSQKLNGKSKISILGANSVGDLRKYGGISQSFCGWEVSPPNAPHNGKPCHMHPYLISDGLILISGHHGIVGMRVKNNVNYLVV